MNIHQILPLHPQNTSSKKQTSSDIKKRIILTDAPTITKAIQEGTLSVDEVTLELSKEMKDSLEQVQEQCTKENQRIHLMNALIQNQTVAKQQEDAAKEATDSQSKSIEIARRIASGGRVPYQDEQYLLEHNPALYQMAKSASIYAKEHKEYDSLLKEDTETPNTPPIQREPITQKHHVQVEVSPEPFPTIENISPVIGDFFHTP